MINEASIRSLRFANASSRLLRLVAILITNFFLLISRSIPIPDVWPTSLLSTYRLDVDGFKSLRYGKEYEFLNMEKYCQRYEMNNFRSRGRLAVHGYILRNGIGFDFVSNFVLVSSESKRNIDFFHLFSFLFHFSRDEFSRNSPHFLSILTSHDRRGWRRQWHERNYILDAEERNRKNQDRYNYAKVVVSWSN